MTQNEYTIKDILQLDACTNCRACADVCPVVEATKDGTLSGIYRVDNLRKKFRRQKGFFRRLFGHREPTEEELNTFSETVYKCTLCGRCQEVCPSGLSLRDLWLSLRQDLVHQKAYPEKVDMILDNVKSSHNVFDEENDERAEWVEDMDDPPDHGYIKSQADVVYFTGCVSAYFPMVQQIPVALAEIFEAAEVDFTLLGEDEWCCGFPLLGAGLKEHFADLVEHNIEAVKKKKADKVVFSCPSCYQMWKEHYPHEFKIYHETQFLAEMMEQGRLKPNRIDKKVTFHDPCDLGRGAGEFEAPRRILSSIEGITFTEMAHNRENSLCCGGGGNLEMIDSQISAQIAEDKVKEALETGSDAVVTACQQCVRTMNTYVRRNKIKLEVLDIVQLLRKGI